MGGTQLPPWLSLAGRRDCCHRQGHSPRPVAHFPSALPAPGGGARKTLHLPSHWVSKIIEITHKHCGLPPVPSPVSEAAISFCRQQPPALLWPVRGSQWGGALCWVSTACTRAWPRDHRQHRSTQPLFPPDTRLVRRSFRELNAEYLWVVE